MAAYVHTVAYPCGSSLIFHKNPSDGISGITYVTQKLFQLILKNQKDS